MQEKYTPPALENKHSKLQNDHASLLLQTFIRLSSANLLTPVFVLVYDAPLLFTDDQRKFVGMQRHL
ncbi:UNVERIFIED_CONTAM: hypothetical protein FKN15_045873 [Acipenser sinensis]